MMIVVRSTEAEEFRNQHANNAYHKRRDLLDCVFNGTWFIHDFKYFEKLPILYQGTDTSKIIELLEEQTSKGEEGVMINVWDAPYDFKRTNSLLKVKKMKTLDLEVVGFEEGNNSNQGTLGALLVRYKDKNIVKVGSGFEKELRDEIWNNKTDWLGRIVEVQYFEETKNDCGGLSLRFPVYKDYRTDKLDADY